MLPKPGGAVFKGIPFAQPPVGDLRWREPMPVKPWTGVYDAGDYRAACAQRGEDDFQKNSSEDCLYLNVWTPEWPASSAKPKAVMVWIHGGGNVSNAARGEGFMEPPFDGSRLIRDGVVVVTVDYRLGLLGFLAHPELDAESPHHTSGNYGLMDQIAALKWVRDNIAKFGGDPGRVTLFGQSAGSVDTTLILTSPLARGLVHRAIAESGTPAIGGMPTPSHQAMIEYSAKLAKQLNAPPTGVIQYLRSLPAAEINSVPPPPTVKVVNDAAKGPESGGVSMMRGEHSLLASVDGYVIPEQPITVYEAGREMRVPLMIGNTSQEWAFGGDTGELKAAIQDFYGPLASQALALYGFTGDSMPPPDPHYGDVGVQFQTDFMFRCGAVLMAGWHSANNPTYQYEFNRAPAPWTRPHHDAELGFLWGFILGGEANDPAARKLSEQVQGYWTNFAKTGDPNGPGLPKWPKYNADTRDYLDFTNKG
jgi:para-nitrobenzyl esterase